MRILRAQSFPASTGLQWLPYRTSTYKFQFYYPTVYVLRQSGKFTFTLRSCTVDTVMQNECLYYFMARKLDTFIFIILQASMRLWSIQTWPPVLIHQHKFLHAAKYASWIPVGHRENNCLEQPILLTLKKGGKAVTKDVSFVIQPTTTCNICSYVTSL